MRRLQISRVEHLRFGRHVDASFDNLDHHFIVLHGPNESGKSTLAEFLTWAIGGPWRAAKDGSERFRLHSEEPLVGRVLGQLGDEPLDMAARFRIRSRGTPADERTVEVGHRHFDAQQFGNLLGDLTPLDYQLMYRLYGVELGKPNSGEDFSDLFTRFAISSTSTTLNPRSRLAALQKRRDETAREQKGIASAIKSVQAEINEANRTPERLDQLRDHQAEIEIQLDRITTELTDSGNLLGDIRAARAALVELNECERLRLELQRLGSVAAGWSEVLPRVTELRAAQGELERLAERVRKLDETARRAASIVGLTTAEIGAQRFSLADRAEIHKAHRRALEAGDELARLEGERTRISAEVSRMYHEVQVHARALGVPPSAAERLVGQAERVRALRTEAALWQQSAAGLARSIDEVREAEAVVEGLEQLDDADATEPSAGPSTPRPTWPFLIAAVAVAGLAFVDPLLVLAGESLVLVLWLVSGWWWSRRQPSVAEPAQSAEHGSQLRSARETLVKAEAASRAAVQRHEEMLESLETAVSELGLELPDAASMNAWFVAAEQLAVSATAAVEAEVQFEPAADRVAKAVEHSARCRSELDRLLVARGISSAPPDDAFDEWLMAYEQAARDANELKVALDQLAERRSEFEQMLQPIAAETAGWSWVAINEQLERHENHAQHRDGLFAALSRAEAAAGGARADDPPIAELLARHRSDEALVMLLSQVEDGIAAADRQRVELVERRTQLRYEIDQLEGHEVLPGLQLRRSGLESQREELENEQRALTVAADILSEVIDRYERDHQDPLVKRAQQRIASVVDGWGTLLYSRAADGKVIIERDGDGGRLDDTRLSDGGRALLYLGIRLACIERDAERRGIRLPVICDDALIHFDDDRTQAGLRLLRDTSLRHQVVLFTCERSTRDLAEAHGAVAVDF